MATNFPGSQDNFVNPTASDTLDSPDHAQQHTDVNDAVEAIELALLDGAPLHIDDVNERVGIGTTTPESTLEVNGILTANHIHGNIAGAVYLHVKNTSGVTIPAGSPVYATGSVGASGATEVAISDADVASTMPALGIVDSELVANAEGHATVLGVAKGLDTSAYSVNDSLYVSTSGGLTNVRPTGASELVQKIGRVIRSDASTGEVLVLGAGRSNDVPNGLSPTITLAGDASGSVTLSELADGTLTVTVNDDSHNHTIANIDSLQTTLDGKAASSHTHSYAATNHTHSYLPTSGGTVTGQLTLGTSASIRQSSSTWTGNPGSGVGKIEYHSNRWYIVAGSNSTELLRVRRDSSDKFVIDNNGSISTGSVPWARLTGVPSIHINSYGNDVTCDSAYADNWFRAKGNTGLYFEDHGTGVHSVTADGGQYGSVSTYGNEGGYEGFSIGGRTVFMHNMSTAWGIYNDVNNEWMIYGVHNGGVELKYNNATRLSVASDRTEDYSGFFETNATKFNHTYCGGGNNQIAFRWSNPYLKASIDNVTCATVVNFSDERVKTDIVSWDGGMDIVRQLRPVTYTPKNIIGFGEISGNIIEGPDVRDETLIGLIAQEVGAVCPSAVARPGPDGEGLQSILPDHLFAILISAVKDIDSRLSAMEAA